MLLRNSRAIPESLGKRKQKQKIVEKGKKNRKEKKSPGLRQKRELMRKRACIQSDDGQDQVVAAPTKDKERHRMPCILTESMLT